VTLYLFGPWFLLQHFLLPAVPATSCGLKELFFLPAIYSLAPFSPLHSLANSYNRTETLEPFVSICLWLLLTTSQLLHLFLNTSILNLFLDNYPPSRYSLISHKPPPTPRQLLNLYWKLVSNPLLLDTLSASNSSLFTPQTPLNPNNSHSTPPLPPWLLLSLHLLLDYSPVSASSLTSPLPPHIPTQSPPISWLLTRIFLFLFNSSELPLYHDYS
jgi:hypothetical protein